MLILRYFQMVDQMLFGIRIIATSTVNMLPHVQTPTEVRKVQSVPSIFSFGEILKRPHEVVCARYRNGVSFLKLRQRPSGIAIMETAH